MAVGLPLKTTYANGDVYSASDVNDTNGTVNLFQTSTLSYSAGKNAIINGGFDIWQRGTSISVSASTAPYTADRWVFSTGVSAASTVSRQTTSDTTNLPTIQYCARVQRNSGQTGTGANYFAQSLETTNSIRYVGQSVTLSFYARKGANFSGASNLLGVFLVSGTGTDQNVITAYTGSATVATSNVTLTTTWQRFTITATVATTATELAAYFSYTPSGTAGTNDYYEITGVQLELGTVTTFSRAGGTIQGELAACQRYYYRVNWDATSAYAQFGAGAGNSTTQVRTDIYFPVQLRKAPTAIDYPTVSTYFTYIKYDDTGGGSPSAVSLDTNLSDTTVGRVNWTGTSITAQGPYYVRGQNQTGAYLGWSAEL